MSSEGTVKYCEKPMKKQAEGFASFRRSLSFFFLYFSSSAASAAGNSWMLLRRMPCICAMAIP